MNSDFKIENSQFGSKKLFWLIIFAVTRDLWMHSDHGSDPKFKRLGATYASGATHQIPNDSSHSFHGAGGGG